MVLNGSGAYKSAVRAAAAAAGTWVAEEAATLQRLHDKVSRLQGG